MQYKKTVGPTGSVKKYSATLQSNVNESKSSWFDRNIKFKSVAAFDKATTVTYGIVCEPSINLSARFTKDQLESIEIKDSADFKGQHHLLFQLKDNLISKSDIMNAEKVIRNLASRLYKKVTSTEDIKEIATQIQQRGVKNYREDNYSLEESRFEFDALFLKVINS
jgi:hypothetical protein